MTHVEPRPIPVRGFLPRFLDRLDLLRRMNPRLRNPGAYLNWMVCNLEILARASRIRGKPLKVVIDPTNLCQLRCPLCPTGLGALDRSHGHASPELIDSLLHEIGDSVFFIDFFNWGEPLLNPHVEDLIRVAAARGILCTVSTNLSLPLRCERIANLLHSGLSELIVSADGASPATYATYRRKGDFELVFDNLRRIVMEKRRLGLASPLITWQFLVFAFNRHEIETAKEMAKEIGVDRIAFRTPLLELDRHPVPKEELHTIAGWATPETDRRSAPVQAGVCGWHYMSAAINWDGSVAPCCTLYHQRDDFGALGARGEHRLSDIRNNTSYRAVRDRFAGRSRGPTGLVCDACPTPSIQNQHVGVNRQIAVLTAVAMVEAVRRLFVRHGPVRPGEPAPAQCASPQPW